MSVERNGSTSTEKVIVKIQPKGTAPHARRGPKVPVDNKVLNAVKALRTKDIEVLLDHIVVSSTANRTTIHAAKAKHRARIVKVASLVDKEVAIRWTLTRAGWKPVISKK